MGGLGVENKRTVLGRLKADKNNSQVLSGLEPIEIAL
jgi:hypothetical protein